MGYRKRNEAEEAEIRRRVLHDPSAPDVDRPPPAGSHRAAGESPDPVEPPDPTATQEEPPEMSPVIYRPEPDPERDPDLTERDEPDAPTRGTFAGPGVPTAKEYASSPPIDPIALDEGLDDDPEISEDELVDEAEDSMLDDMESVRFDDDMESVRFDDDEEPVRFDDDLEEPESEPMGPVEPEPLRDVAVTTPVPPPIPQRRRRRIFGHHDESEVFDPELPDSEIPPPPDEEPPPPEPDLPDSEIPPEPVDELPEALPAEEPAPEAGPEAETPVLRGHVLSSRGRGLSGMTVTVLDSTGDAVTTATTGRRGGYAIAHLDPGTYWIVASDGVDGDFHDGTHHDHAPVEVREGRPLEGIDVHQAGRVAIDAAFDAGSSGLDVEIRVLDRSTGMPATGTVTVTTEHFGTLLPLRKGRAHLTLLGEPEGRLRVEYSGARHNAAAKRTVRLP